jgi:hypothetical protein
VRLDAIARTLRRSSDTAVLASFVASRLILLVAAFAAEFMIARNPALTSGDNAPLLRSFTSWDGWYFLGIARDGYHAGSVAGQYHDYAFLPLYPGLVAVLSFPWPQFAGLVAVLTANLATLVALLLLARLGEPLLGRRRASAAAAALAVWPFASAFGMAYSDGVFLALIVGAFLAAERDRRIAAGVLLGLACLTRFQGIPLVAALWLLELRRDGWRPRPSQAWLLLGPVAAAGFLAAIALVSGSATAYLDAQTDWGRHGFGGSPQTETIAAAISPYQAALIAALCWAVFLWVFMRRDRLPLHYAVVPVLFLGAELSSGSLEAVGRVTMAAFPYVWLIAARRSIFATRVWPIVSVGLFALIAVLSFGGYWVP